MVRNAVRSVVCVSCKTRAYDFGGNSFRALVLRLPSYCIRRFFDHSRKAKQTRIFPMVERDYSERYVHGFYVRNEKSAARRSAFGVSRNHHRKTFLFGQLRIPRGNRVLVRLSSGCAVWVYNVKLAAFGS